MTDMYALLGEIVFEVLTSPEVFRSTTDYHYAEHKVIEARPRLQWLATELQKISLDLGFHVAFTNPATQMNRLRRAAEDHQARALVFGNGVHRGYFVVESIEETHHQDADDGSFVAISARVELCEWVPGGVGLDPLAPPRRSAPPPGIVTVSPAFAQTGSAAPAGSAPTFNPFQPIGLHNLLPTSAIVQLGQAGAGPGVTYSAATYSQPGVSGIVRSGPAAALPGNIGNVSPSTIVRAG
jgi:phage protein U